LCDRVWWTWRGRIGPVYFLDENNFQTSATNPTKTFQNEIRKTVNHSTTLTRIPQESKWGFIKVNPSAPTIKGLIKLHKSDQPIRPIVNWRNAPVYKLSKLFTQIQPIYPIAIFIQFKNTPELVQNLKQPPLLPTFTLASLDITNTYSNIPITETKKSLKILWHTV